MNTSSCLFSALPILIQVKKIVGKSAPEEFVRAVEELADAHHPQLKVDITRAYHFGARYNVEMEVRFQNPRLQSAFLSLSTIMQYHCRPSLCMLAGAGDSAGRDDCNSVP